MISRGLRAYGAVLFGSTLCLLVGNGTAMAAWPSLPTVNLPLFATHDLRLFPDAISDGVGGAFVAWDGYGPVPDATQLNDVYVQHVLASGVVDPAWPADGVDASPLSGYQFSPKLVPDGSGGALVCWYDNPVGNTGTSAVNLFAQHVFASGVIDPAWPLGGRALCAAVGEQNSLRWISDGAGGAFAAWIDRRSGTNYDIYAQHVLASGALHASWPLDGLPVCTAALEQVWPDLVTDGSTGALVFWSDGRNGIGQELIYTQHLLGAGTADPAWPAGGRILYNIPSGQLYESAVADGSGGAIVVWRARDAGQVGAVALYSHHVLASGDMNPLWPSATTVTKGWPGNLTPSCVTDGAGGVLVVWYTTGPYAGSTSDIMAQRITATGGKVLGWPANGRAVCAAVNGQVNPAIIADGSGGAFVTWMDQRTDASGAAADIYAQRVNGSGLLDARWPLDGAAVCTAALRQRYPHIVLGTAGGAIIAWSDNRDGASWDVYAQRIGDDGVLGDPPALGVGEGTVKLELALAAPTPNPASRRAALSWWLPRAGSARLAIYDAAGRAVRVLFEGQSPAGGHAGAWDLLDCDGREASPGLYFARLVTDLGTRVQRIAVTQ
jgi:hypothetical protein